MDALFPLTTSERLTRVAAFVVEERRHCEHMVARHPENRAYWQERVAQAEMLQEYGLRRALEDILIVEEEHARDLQDALEL